MLLSPYDINYAEEWDNGKQVASELHIQPLALALVTSLQFDSKDPACYPEITRDYVQEMMEEMGERCPEIREELKELDEALQATTIDETMLRIEQGKLVIIQTGGLTHSICVVIGKGYLLICNRGFGNFALDDYLITTRAFKIKTQPTREMIEELFSSRHELSNYGALPYLYGDLPKSLGAFDTNSELLDVDQNLEKALHTREQKVGNLPMLLS